MSEYEDLKTWLRNFKPADVPWSVGDVTPSNIRDAADAIEVLEKNEQQAGWAIERLTNERAQLEAENKRLREALEEIAGIPDSAGPGGPFTNWAHLAETMRFKARAALATQAPGSEPR